MLIGCPLAVAARPRPDCRVGCYYISPAHSGRFLDFAAFRHAIRCTYSHCSARSHVRSRMSMPGPPTHVSFPASPIKVSIPPPPTMQSLPPAPEIVSAPGPPKMRLLLPVPLITPLPTMILLTCCAAHSAGLRSSAV